MFGKNKSEHCHFDWVKKYQDEFVYFITKIS